jgi:putative peptide maturation dehydrogenase
VPQVKRSTYLFLTAGDVVVLDIGLLLRGEISAEFTNQLQAVSLVKGELCPISADEVRMAFEIPSERWISVEEALARPGARPDLLDGLARKGVVLTDCPEPELAELTRRHERLCHDQWNPYAALYHFMTKWRDVDVHAHMPSDPAEFEEINQNMNDVYESFIDRYGMPPPAFLSVNTPLEIVDLPPSRREDGLFGRLAGRRTTRAFDPEVPLHADDLSVLLYYVFGCHGTSTVFRDIVAVKKTSPSGGSLHPTEAYVLLINAAGFSPGVYHYNVQNHSLEMIARLDRQTAQDWANEFTAGQTYPRNAQALFIMTSRFYRNFWKYRQHQKAYAVLLMDAAHLSQAFYLIAAELGLGAFVTAAINSVNIEQKLQLDGYEQGAIAICGCGKPATVDVIDPQFKPYIPWEGRPPG